LSLAAAQVGNMSAAVRMAGAYAMAALADETGETAKRQQCIDVPCAYLRLPYQSGHGSDLLEQPRTGCHQTARLASYQSGHGSDLLEQLVVTDTAVAVGGKTHTDQRTFRLLAWAAGRPASPELESAT
jgi:hypothetical protein